MPKRDKQKNSPDLIPENPNGNRVTIERKRNKPLLPFLLTFLIMMALWVVLSGKFDPFHLGLGIISCLLVAYFSSDLLFDSPRIKKLAVSALGFIQYIPWLLYQIFLANVHLLYLTFHPKIMELIDPKIIRFRRDDAVDQWAV